MKKAPATPPEGTTQKILHQRHRISPRLPKPLNAVVHCSSTRLSKPPSCGSAASTLDRGSHDAILTPALAPPLPLPLRHIPPLDSAPAAALLRLLRPPDRGEPMPRDPEEQAGPAREGLLLEGSGEAGTDRAVRSPTNSMLRRAGSCISTCRSAGDTAAWEQHIHHLQKKAQQGGRFSRRTQARHKRGRPSGCLYPTPTDAKKTAAASADRPHTYRCSTNPQATDLHQPSIQPQLVSGGCRRWVRLRVCLQHCCHCCRAALWRLWYWPQDVAGAAATAVAEAGET